MELLTIHYFDSKIPAGFPSPATDYLEKRIDLTKEFVKHPLSTFIIESEGYSMVNAFIPPKAKLIVDRSITPQNGDVILAVLNGEFTVKYFKKNEHNCFLTPANSKFPEIQITDGMDFQVWGVVTYVIVDTKETKCML